MPTLSHDYLHSLAFEVFKALDTPEDEARTVADHLISANLAGHDSHGIIQVPIYVDRIHRGHIVPGAPFQVTKETPSTVSVDGNWGFGFVVTEKTMGMVIEKARQHNVASGTIARQSHIGRLTDYALMAAEQGMVGLMTADSGRLAKIVAPFGGREARLGTNPICIAMPSDLEGPVFIDMATAAVAGNKLVVAASRGEKIEEGLLLDVDGNPTTDPNEYMKGGTILPVGGPQGHKGYGLGFMVEIFTSLLTGLGFGPAEDGAPHNDGVFMAVFNVAAFRPLEQFKQDVAEFTRYVKTSAPAQGYTEVFYPGELEWLSEQRKRRDGIDVEDATWKKLQELIQEFGLTDLAEPR